MLYHGWKYRSNESDELCSWLCVNAKVLEFYQCIDTMLVSHYKILSLSVGKLPSLWCMASAMTDLRFNRLPHCWAVWPFHLVSDVLDGDWCVCEQLAHNHYMTLRWPGPVCAVKCKSIAVTTTKIMPQHYAALVFADGNWLSLTDARASFIWNTTMLLDGSNAVKQYCLTRRPLMWWMNSEMTRSQILWSTRS